MTVIVDVSSLANRAFYASNRASFFTMLEIVAEEMNDDFLFVFDGENNWRKTVYPPYKANRTDNPNKPLILTFLRNIWRVLRQAGHSPLYYDTLEADDVIANVVSRGDIVLTSDKDLFGTICQGAVVYFIPTHFADRRLVDGPQFVQEYGFNPCYFYVWKALVGDRGDNVPGVTGIGPVRATKMVMEQGNNISLTKGQEQFNLAFQLVSPKQESIDKPKGLTYNYKEVKNLWQILV